MEAMKYVEIAKSKDPTRFNLCEVYRDKTEIVATNGHRMHWSNHLPEVEPHYLSGLDAEFPSWRTVLPTENLSATAEIGLLAGEKGKFKALLGCLKNGTKHNRVFVKFIPVVDSSPARCEIKTTQLDGMECSMEFYTMGCSREFSFCVNAQYFFDALSPLVLSKDCTASLSLKFYGDLNPILIDYNGKLDSLHALIMPMK